MQKTIGQLYYICLIRAAKLLITFSLSVQYPFQQEEEGMEVFSSYVVLRILTQSQNTLP